MISLANTLVPGILLGALWCAPGFGQPTQPAILQIDIENWVQYVEDTTDFSKFASNLNPTPAATPRNFAVHLGIADIVAVNGQPAKGTMIRNLRNMNLSRTIEPGRGIGDILRGAAIVDTFEILNQDGDTIGTIITSGLAAGPPAPGAPVAVTQGNFAVIGGSGAFMGVRGQSGQAVTAQTVTLRAASMTEDPSRRRQHGGGKARWVMHLIPVERPEIATIANGPAVAHASDSTLVSASNPAAPGELLSLYATGLGPTRPGVDPGSPFPSLAPAVASPVSVLVNGQPAEVVAATGYPGVAGVYQVNFRTPEATPPGTSRIQVSAAWIPGSAVQIAIH